VQSTAGKPQDSASPDMPFSQVLSSEIAQNRNSSQAKQDPDSQTAPAAAAPQADRPAAAVAESASDPLIPGPVELGSFDPATALALAINPDHLNLAPAGSDTVDAEAKQAPDLNASTLPLQGARKGQTAMSAQAAQAALAAQAAQAAQAVQADPALPGKATLHAAAQAAPATALAGQQAKGGDPKGQTLPSAQDEHAAGNTRDTQKTDFALPGKAALNAAAQAATATAFSGQLAEVRNANSTKAGEALPDLSSNPAMRPVSQGPLEALNTPDKIAAPRLAPAVGTPAWGQALGEKIVWMATAAQQTATLTLNPPNMGPLQIVVNVSNEQATASFFSAQPEVRQALEAAFPRLREMMSEAGIQLGQASVSADTPRQDASAHRQGQANALPFPVADDPAATGLQTVQAPVRQSGRGLIDMFA